MSFSWTRKLTFLLAFVLLASVPALAQTTVGTISGTVTDPTGAVVPGATVTLVNEATGVTREATTNEQGGFVFDRARVGTYTLRITMSGFKVHEQRNLEVSAGKVSALGEVKLEVGRTDETITIEGTVTPLVQGDSPQIVGAYDARKVQDINWGTFGLDATSFLTAGIVPGFGNINTNSGGFSGQTGSGGQAPAAAGQRSRSTQFSFDGHEINDISIGGPAIFIDNQDIVGEYQVTVNTFDAAGGRLPGAQVNILTKSGTNEFHGSLFYFYESAGLRGSDSTESKFDLEKPKEVDHQFGFTAGGPVIKNKWFVFGAHHRERSPGTAFDETSTTLGFTQAGATALFGDFPSDTTATYLTRGPFAIPDGSPRCTAGSTRFIPVTGGNPAGYEACGVTRDVPDAFFSWELLVKMDVVLSKQSFSGKYYQESEPYCCFSIGGGSEAAGYWVGVPFKDTSFSINHTYQFSPRVLNDFRFSYGKFLVSFEGANTEPISNLRGNLTRLDMPTGLTPVGGGATRSILSMGLPTNLPQGRLLYNFQWSDNLSIVRGRHTIKAGLEFRRNRTTAPFLPFVNGRYLFTTMERWVNNTPDSTSFTEGPFALQAFETDQFYYVQDDIRLRPNLTINLGLRYEHTGAPSNVMAEETLARETGPGAFWNPAVPIEGRTYAFNDPDSNNWGPRIGFAYTPRFWKGLFGEDKTVIRGGYSVAYEAAFYNILLNMSTAAPRVFAFGLAPGVPIPPGATGSAVAGSIPTPLGVFDPRSFFRTQISPDFASPTIQTWTLGAQREIGNNVVFEARYVGTKSNGQYQSINANPQFRQLFLNHPEEVPFGLVPCAAPLFPAALNRVHCDSGPLRMRLNGASSIYHGLQSRLDFRNVWNQLTGGLSYSFGKSIDNVSEIFNFTGQGAFVWAENVFNYRDFERGRSNFDLRHYFAGHYIWDSPWHRDQQGALGKIAGGWQINGQVFLFSGRPWTPQAQNGFSTTGGINTNCREDTAFNGSFIGVNATCRPLAGDPTAPVRTHGPIGSATRWWDNPGNVSGIPFGGSRNVVVGDATQLVNMGLFKNTRFGPEGRFNLQMRWTMVNAFNVRNFGVPASVFVESGSFGIPENRNFIPGRINRLALRFTF